ncbi:hypothetical protein EGW08_004490, partial [Elysia chlorotica]
MTVSKYKCPRKEGSCDFELDDCGFTVDNKNGWTRRMKASTGNFLTPSQDHTTGDVYGYFMHVRAGPDLERQSVSMVSEEREQSLDQDACVYFWYHLRGPDVGRLAVKLRTSESVGDRSMWTMGKEQGDRWLQGRVQIPRGTGRYQLVFEAHLTDGVQGSIAVDDIQQEMGACPPEGTCDFDLDLCGYTSHTHNTNNDAETESRWLRLTSKYQISQHGPSAEHTQRHLNGGYAASDQFSFLAFEREPIARLLSPFLSATEKSCMSFWYYFDGFAEGTLRVLIGDVERFNTSSRFKDWRYSGVIEYENQSAHQIIFESERQGRGNALIAVDDILVGDCDDFQTPGTQSRDKTTEAPKPSIIPNLPVPDEGDTDHPLKINCYAYCMHFTSCYQQGKSHVYCVCQTGYSGSQCNIPDQQNEKPSGLDDNGNQDMNSKTSQTIKSKTDEGQGSNGGIIAVAVVAT